MPQECQTLLQCGMALVVAVGLCEVEDEQTGIVVEAVHFSPTEMAMDLGVGPEKAGGIGIEIGSVRTSITENALTGETMKGLLNEMIEIENLLFGGMIIRPVGTALEIKLQGSRGSLTLLR